MRWGRLLRKELREILRDRRTIITLVLMPLLLYPLLGLAFRQFFLTNLTASSPLPFYKIGVGSKEEADFLNFYLGVAGQIRLKDAGPKPVPFKFFLMPNVDEDLRKGTLDLGIHLPGVPQTWQLGRRLELDIEVRYVPQSSISEQALSELEKRLALANQQALLMRLNVLRERLLQLQPQRPVQEQATVPTQLLTTAVNVKPPSVTLAALIPIIVILMTRTGGVYPAIDLTAGERERGTLEVLMAAPIPRMSLLFAKYVAVLAVALLTALVNLFMMTVTLYASRLGPLLLGDTGLSVGLVVKVLGLLLLFASFFSAVLLTLASFARSFKEAQAYLIPLTLLSLAPGLLGIIPGISLSRPLAVTPVINMALLARDLFEGHVAPELAAIAIVATLAYNLAALAVAARVFGAEAVLYSEQSGWSDLFRRPAEPHDVPSLSNALLCLASVLPAYFVLTGLLSYLPSESLGPKLAQMAAANVLLFAAFPIGAALLSHVRVSTGLLCRPPSIWALLAAACLGISLWPPLHELGLLMRLLEWVNPNTVYQSRVDEMIQQWRELPLAGILLALAVSPAVCEELLFRGYLFSALRGRGPAVAIGVSAVIFGLFHTIMGDIFSVERLLPTTLLGVVLGWVCWRSGSVFPGMLLHALHNACLITLAYFQPELAHESWYSPDSHLAAMCYVGAAVGIGLGVVLLLAARPVGEENEGKAAG